MPWMLPEGVVAGVLLAVITELEHKRHDRSEEAAADERGLELLGRAGISPSGLGTFFRRLEAEPTLPELLSTHPDPGARAARAEAAANDGRTRIALPSMPERWTCDAP